MGRIHRRHFARAGLTQVQLALLAAFVACDGGGDPVPPPPSEIFIDSVLPTEGHPGWTEGNFEVTARGSASYTIPISVPAGRRGLTPELSLEYDSQSANGLLGVGWTLVGVSSITPCPYRMALDGRTDFPDAHETPTTEPQPAFCLDGVRIRADGRLDTDGHTRVVEREGGFTVFTRDGRVLIYGNAADEDPAILMDGPDHVAAYYVSQIQDRYGNAIRFRYDTARSGAAAGMWPRNITYTEGPISGSGSRRISFEYDETRPDAIQRFVSGGSFREWKRITRIRVEYLGSSSGPGAVPALIRSYDLEYTTSAPTSRSLLQSVTECDGGRVCREPIVFEYSQPEPVPTPARDIASGMIALESIADPDAPFEFARAAELAPGDVNHDGHQDILASSDNQTLSWRLLQRVIGDEFTEHTTDIPANWHAALFDFDLDGKSDLLTAHTTEIGGVSIDMHRLHGMLEAIGPDPTAWTYKLTMGAPSPLSACSEQTLALGSADLDGNGAPDVLVACSSNWRARLHSDTTYDPADVGVPFGSYAERVDLGPGLSESPEGTGFFVIDLEGDGRHDVLRVLEEPDPMSPMETIRKWVRHGLDPRGEPVEVEAVDLEVDVEMVTLDVNGDGLDDVLLLGPATGPVVRFNHGGSFGAATPALQSGAPLGTWAAQYATRKAHDVRVADFNADARDDFVVFFEQPPDPFCSRDPEEPHDCVEPPRGAVAVLHLSDGLAYRPVEIGSPGRPNWVYSRAVRGDVFVGKRAAGWVSTVADSDGNGLPELFVYFPDEVTEPSAGLTSRAYLDEFPDLLRSVSRRRGATINTTEIEYGTTRNAVDADYFEVDPNPNYRGFRRYDYPVRPETAIRPIVSRHTDEHGKGYSYTYFGSFYDVRGTGWTGFSYRWIVEEDSLTVTELAYTGRVISLGKRVPTLHPDYILTVTPPSEHDAAAHLERTDYRYDLWLGHTPVITSRIDRSFESEGFVHSCVIGGGIALLRCNASDTDSLTPFREVREHYNYDSEGTVVIHQRDVPGVETRLTRIVPEHRPASMLFGLPREVTIESELWTRPESATRRFDLLWDDAGGLEQIIVDPGGPAEMLRTHTIASDGLVERVEITDGTSLRWVELEYDGDRTHIAASTNALGTTQVAVHPYFDAVVWERDLLGQITRHQIDAFGRPRTTTDPVGRTTTRYGFAPGDLMFIETVREGLSHETAAIDRWGRIRQLRSFDRSSDGWTVQNAEYDARSRLIWQELPHLETEPPRIQELRYDWVNRLRRVVLDDGHEDIRIDYSGNRVATARRRDGAITYTTFDSVGRRVLIEEPGARASDPLRATFYEYGPFGSLTTVRDHAGNAWTWRYDDYGRLRRTTDPDAGTRLFGYDGLGQLTRETVPGIGVTKRYTYDELGRIETFQSPADGTTTFEWDTAANGIGQLAAATTASGVATSFEYDSLGRPERELTSVGGEEFEIQYRWDRFGRLGTLGYLATDDPNHQRIEYRYSDFGRLVSVHDRAGERLWEATERDAVGRATHTLQGAVETESRFEPIFGRRVHSESRAASGEIVTGDAQLFDADGMLRARADLRYGTFETFDYDGANRLSAWGFEGRTHTFGYDTIGNLTNRDGALQAYGPGPLPPARYGPHQLRSVPGGGVIWDNLGRLRSMPGLSITSYSAFDLPKTLATPRGTTRMDYDAFGSRVVKDGPTGRTTYIGGLYERREAATTTHVFHVVADGTEVAQIVREDGEPERRRFLHTDEAGSVLAVTDESGASVEELRYDPLGHRITPGTDLLTAYSGPIHDGFTGHDHEDDLGLINMGGRLYSPLTGRFTTPDPFLLLGQGSEGLNPYSYVLNDPMNHADPGGAQPCDTPCGAGAAGAGFASFVAWVVDRLRNSDSSSGSSSGRSSEGRDYGTPSPPRQRPRDIPHNRPAPTVFDSESATGATAPVERSEERAANRSVRRAEERRPTAPPALERRRSARGAPSDWLTVPADALEPHINYATGVGSGLSFGAGRALWEIVEPLGAAGNGEVVNPHSVAYRQGEIDGGLVQMMISAASIFQAWQGASVATGGLFAARGATAGGAMKALPAARQTEAAWGASTYRHGGLMTGMEHIMYRHSAGSGFAHVSRFAEGTTARNIVGYVDRALRYGMLTQTGPTAYTIEYNLGRTIGTNIAGDTASSIRVFVRDGIIQTAFPF